MKIIIERLKRQEKLKKKKLELNTKKTKILRFRKWGGRTGKKHNDRRGK